MILQWVNQIKIRGNFLVYFYKTLIFQGGDYFETS